MNGLWIDGEYVLQATLEDREARLQARVTELEVLLREAFEIIDERLPAYTVLLDHINTALGIKDE